MSEHGQSALGLNALLAAVEAARPVDAAEVVAAALAEELSAVSASFLIADYGGECLIRLSFVERVATRGGGLGRERAERVPIEGTPQGRAIVTQSVEVVERGRGAWDVLAPVTSRGEAIGVLEVRLGHEPDERTLDKIRGVSHALAYIVIANRRFTDLFEWGQRSVPLSLEAEIQHRLLPASFTCEGGRFTLAGWLEPAGDVGGDTFDFSVDRDFLHLSLTDAMGHTLEAALLATVMVGASRNGRRAGLDLASQAQGANEALLRNASDGGFVTGQLVRIDLDRAMAMIVNAGHPPPVRVRDGEAESIELAADSPFGMTDDVAYRVQQLALQAGDRLVFLTDGMLERDASGVDLAWILVRTRALHPREAVRQLTRAVVEASGGVLRDDATVLLVDWHGGAYSPRDAPHGADR
jgi:serine phosphatase RsbU (regulator of sigma subunit)